MATATEEDVRDALESGTDKFPSEPAFTRLEFEFGAWQDPKTFTVWLIFPDDTPEEKMGWQQIEPFSDVIFDAIQESGLDLWPIVKARTESEFEAQSSTFNE